MISGEVGKVVHGQHKTDPEMKRVSRPTKTGFITKCKNEGHANTASVNVWITSPDSTIVQLVTRSTGEPTKWSLSWRQTHTGCPKRRRFLKMYICTIWRQENQKIQQLPLTPIAFLSAHNRTHRLTSRWLPKRTMTENSSKLPPTAQ